MIVCVCLHGYGENKEIYTPFVEKMSKYFPTFSLDLLGHGECLRPEYKVSDAVEVLAEKLLSFDSDLLLVGTSFGGILSYILSSDNQEKYAAVRDRVKGVIINDVPCCIPKVSFVNLATNLFNLAEKRYTSTEELDHDYTHNGFKLDRVPISDANWQHFLDASLRDGRVKYDVKFIDMLLSEHNGVATLAPGVCFNKMPDDTYALDLRYYYNAISKPILLFVGERTTFFPKHVHEFMDAHATTEKHIIGNGGHFLDMTRDEVMNQIGTWLVSHAIAPTITTTVAHNDSDVAQNSL